MSKVKSAELQRAVYTGPEQHLDVRVPDGQDTKLVPLACIPGQPLDIADDHPIAVTFAAAGFLGPAIDPAPATAAPAITE